MLVRIQPGALKGVEMADIVERFEAFGMLYYRRFHRLRPGKDEPRALCRSSNEPDNVAQYEKWFEGQALYDAIDRIVELEAENEKLKEELEDERYRSRGDPD